MPLCPRDVAQTGQAEQSDSEPCDGCWFRDNCQLVGRLLDTNASGASVTLIALVMVS